MMAKTTDLPYPHLPRSVNRRIAEGVIPPPRGNGDAPDEVRDLRLAIAIAEATGDSKTSMRLGAELLAAEGEGARTTWKPQPRTEAPPKNAAERDAKIDELRGAVQDATNAGEWGEAAKLGRDLEKLELQSALVGDDGFGEVARGLLTEAKKLEDAGDGEAADKKRAEALRYELEGPAWPSGPPPEPGPTTIPELQAAVATAERDGDHDQADKYRAGMLLKSRQEREAER